MRPFAIIRPILAALLAYLVLTLAQGPVAGAATAVKPFGVIPCAPQSGVLFCQGNVNKRVPSFDGVPIDLNVTLPGRGRLKNLPLVIISHGWGGSKVGLDTSGPVAQRGYAVLAITARGFGDSCGSQASRNADPSGCAKGWIHLEDDRFEIRDVQYLAGLLADQGIINPRKIALTGASYGGGVSLATAVLKDRILDATDNTLKPWTNPMGKPMRVAAAAPLATWSDLSAALTPNGGTLDYTITGPTDDLDPSGIMKQSLVTYLYNTGLASGFYAPEGIDPEADLTTWYNAISAGEPYDGNLEITQIKTEITTYHSSYYIDDSEPPPPLLLANGFTDDLFPVDEMVRYYNRTRMLYPKAPIAMMLLDFGHPRAQNKTADVTALLIQVLNWFDRYVKGMNVPVIRGVRVMTETCPSTARSGGPFNAPNWVALHPGEVRFTASDNQQFSGAGDSSIASAIDPISGGGACVQTASTAEPNTANWLLPAITGKGYTLMGAPAVIADLEITGAFPEVAARLWDVAPNGMQTLVARGLFRPATSGMQVFQLHPGAWHFAKGHVAKFQLLAQDSPYARVSNGTFSISVPELDLRLPVHEKPDCKQVMPPAAPVVPSGATLAPGVNPNGGSGCGHR